MDARGKDRDGGRSRDVMGEGMIWDAGMVSTGAGMGFKGTNSMGSGMGLVSKGSNGHD